MKLVYWVAPILDDRPEYNIRARTRRECSAARIKDGADRFGPPQKVIVEYVDAFDLLCRLQGEGGSFVELAGRKD